MDPNPDFLDAKAVNVLLVGGGGIGAIAALNLDVGGRARVSLVLRSNFTAVEQGGYEIESFEHGHVHNWRPHEVLPGVPRAQDYPEPFHYVICTMKNIPDIAPTVMDIVHPAITPSVTAIVLIQNGLGIEQPFQRQYPHNVVLSGISYTGSSERAHGMIHQLQPDILRIGSFPSDNIDDSLREKIARDFIERYKASGKTNVSFTADVAAERWRKLLYNATINPLSAILGMSAGQLHRSGATIAVAQPAMMEIRAIAAAKGIYFSIEDVQSVFNMSIEDADFVPSMGVDRLKGNLMECEVIVGAPVKDGAAVNVPTPILSTLYKLCQALQAQTLVYRQSLAA